MIWIAISALSLALTPAQRAADVTSSLGVNVHIEYTDGGYRDLGRVLACLNYIGIHTVRDESPNPANQGQAGYAALAKAGVKFDLFVNGGDIPPALQRISDLVRQAPGSVVSIEGPNEVNNHNAFSFSGEQDPHLAGAKFQTALYREAKRIANLSTVPVVAFTDFPYRPGLSDVGNEHPYQPADSNVTEGLSKVIAGDAAVFPGHPIVFTELGYTTMQAKPGASELAQARLLLASLLTDAAAGVGRTYIYELLDAYPDPGGVNSEKHFGLFNVRYEPKTAARMLRLLTSLYRDDAPNARDFKLRTVQLSWSNLAGDIHKSVVQKADGEIVIAVWRSIKMYDFSRGDDIGVQPEVVDIRLPPVRGSVVVNDPVSSTRGEVRPGAPLLRLSVGADPLIVQIKPGSGQRAGAT